MHYEFNLVRSRQGDQIRPGYDGTSITPGCDWTL